MISKSAKSAKRVTAKTYIANGLMMIGYILIFSIMGIFFISADIPGWIVICVSFLFLLPPVAICFISGKSQGERMFSYHHKSVREKTGKSPYSYPYYKSIFYVISFAAPCIILAILCFAFKSFIMRGLLYFLYLPITLLFEQANVLVIDAINVATPIIYIITTLLYCGIFILSYCLQMYRLKCQQGAIESEIRSFNN